MSPITSHILDLSSGHPARGVTVLLSFKDGPHLVDLARSMTDADGRVRDLLPEGAPLEVGIYRLSFSTYEYFFEKGVKSFFPSVDIEFVVDDPSGHFHVPLLLSPFGYSTYRGS
jgi:5-hydroxyisourate hydrolase